MCRVETLSSRQVYANSWMTVREDRIRRADGTDGIYGVIDKPTYALVIPRDGDRLQLVEQFRYPVGRAALGVPGRHRAGPGRRRTRPSWPCASCRRRPGWWPAGWS